MNRPQPDFDMKLKAARTIAEELVSWGYAENIDQVAEEIAKAATTTFDGYELAKELDFRGWDCDFQICEILNGFSYSLSNVLRDAEKKWATENNIQPPLPLGMSVVLNSKETGVIDKIYAGGPAKYAIKIDGDEQADTAQQRRRVVNFEDVKAAQSIP